KKKIKKNKPITLFLCSISYKFRLSAINTDLVDSEETLSTYTAAVMSVLSSATITTAPLGFYTLPPYHQASGARSLFSTYPPLSSTGGGPNFKGGPQGPAANPEVGAFRIKDIVKTRNGRIALYGTFTVLAAIEGATWWNFAPQVFGKKGGEAD
ncbi:hypothetical protein BX600DRAFT_29241, partial [Xylariales sp. PMI_506]